MKEHTFERSVTAATQPNFDDERTLQSARPVVPLEKIDAKLRHRRQWFLGGAFAVAMILGAASALLASYLRLRNVSPSNNEISQVEVTPQPVAVAETVASELPVDEGVEASVPPVTPRKEPSVMRKTVAPRDSSLAPPPADRGLSEEEELNRIRDAILVDQWQERRMRRAVRRERRSRFERYNPRGLSNLDEIFEGPSRP